MNCFSADNLILRSLDSRTAMLVDVVPIAQNYSNAASAAVRLNLRAGFQAEAAFTI